MRAMIWGAALLLSSAALAAVSPAELEATAKRLEKGIMAPCCGANPVSDHYSPAAEAAKREIREMLAAGLTEEQVLARFVERHGDTILSSPPARGFGLVAWLGPLVLMLLAGLGVVAALGVWKRRTTVPEAAPPEVNPADRARIERELSDYR